MSRRCLNWFCCGVCFALASVAFAAAPAKPVVGPGATKDQVIDAYGWPNGSSQMGTKEVLNYSQGRVTLENGKVERVDFSPDVPWQTPKPRPGTIVVPTKADTPVDFWMTDYEAARREADARKARILALFTGSDWSPASRKFQNEVALNEDFANAFIGQFVFLKLDFPTRIAQSDAEKAQNAALRERYHVTTYPSLLVLSPDGFEVGRVDLAKVQDGDAYRPQIMSAIATVQEFAKRAVPGTAPVVVDPSPAAGGNGSSVGTDAAPGTAAEAAGGSAAAQAAASVAVPTSRFRAMVTAVTPSTVSPMWVILLGGLAGIGIAGFLVWLLWLHKPKVAMASPKALLATPTSRKGGRVVPPSLVTVAHWPFPRVKAVAAALFEAEGYTVEQRGSGEVALALTKRGQTTPILVSCRPALGGLAPARVVRELFGTVTVEGAEAGWFVSLSGFSGEASEFAREHGLVLIDAQEFIARIGALPPDKMSNVNAHGEALA